MTDRHTRTNRSAVDLSATVPWVNDSGEEVPAYGVVQLRTDFDTTSHVSKPNGSDGLFFVNGHAPVAISKHGESLLWSQPRPVLLELGVTVGDQVGPVDGEWKMTPNGSGFRVIRQPNEEGIGVVVQVGGAGGSGAHWIEFTVVDVYCPGDYDYDDEIGKGRYYVDAEVNWYSGSCTTAPPGFDEYTQTVRIFDTCIIKFYTADQLLGESPPYVQPMSGDAVWVYPFRSDECVPEWHVKAVCGAPSCGDTVSPPPPEEEE
jgi:hypothetical protein